MKTINFKSIVRSLSNKEMKSISGGKEECPDCDDTDGWPLPGFCYNGPDNLYTDFLCAGDLECVSLFGYGSYCNPLF